MWIMNGEYSLSKVSEESLRYFNGDSLASQVWVSKYALKDKQGEFLEVTPDQMHQRLSAEFARIESKFSNDGQMSEEDIYDLLKDFKKIVPQGSPMMGIGNNQINTSLSNCVVVESPSDDMSSIMNAGRDLANLFKRRCGVGLDLSSLRPSGSKVSNSAGTTTGAWSFADFYSHVCRMVGQNGRRGALMLSMDIRHPDIENFTTMKNDLTKVTGANISIRINDEFMKAVESDSDFTLQYPVESESPTHTKTISAKDLWETIVRSAKTTAEPGLLMWDNILNYLPANAYPEFKTICTNPCAEIPLSAYDSCRLISINLKHFVLNAFEEYPAFNFEDFSKTVQSAMRLSDDLVELELEKLSNLIQISDTEDEKSLWGKLLTACENGRRTGLGTHGLADALARLNLPYDSDEALKITDEIYKTLKCEAYKESINLAQERGAFPAFNYDLEKDNLFIKSLPQEIQDGIKLHGRRNISILTNAPTGSVSLMSQTSSGLEPVFRNSYVRRRKIEEKNKTEKSFVDDVGDVWDEYEVFHHNILEWKTLNPDQPLPDFFTESQNIKWEKRVEIQATIQQHIDHAISSTINLPSDTTEETVSEIYLKSWRLKLKGVTVYVDGSRSGVLVTKKEKETFPQNQAPKRPALLECDIHYSQIQSEKWIILVGLLEDKPYEIFGGKASLIEIPKKYTTGKISKRQFKTQNGKYDLHIGDEGLVIKDVVSVFNNPNNLAFARMISLGLRHGAKAKFMVEQLLKDRNSDMFSFSKCIARILKGYIENGEVPSDKRCDDCGNDSLIYQDGCVSCTDCGYGKCS